MKKALALFLSLLMVLALVPSAFAAGEVAVALEGTPTGGDQVAIFYPAKSTVISTIANGSKLDPVDVTLEEDKITLSANAAIFDVATETSGETTLYTFSADGKYLTSGATGQSLTFADTLTEYGKWILEPEGTTGYLIKNYKAEYNNNGNIKPQYIEFYNQFTTYSLSSSHTAYTFRFFKLTGESAVLAPTANPASGTIAKDSQVKLTTETAGATIYWKIGEEGTYAAYTEPITISEDCTLFAYAEKDGKQSAVVQFAYTVFEGAMSIPQALAAVATGDIEGAKVVGQVAYRFGSKGSNDSFSLQAKIGGEISALQVFGKDTYDNGDPIQVGDWVVLTGKLWNRYSVYQISPVTEARKAEEEERAGMEDATEPQVFESFADLTSNYDAYLSEYVMIKNVKLGEYKGDGTTVMTDSAGATMNVYQAAPYPPDLQAGDVVNLLAAASKHNNSKQLRNGSSRDYIPTNDAKGPTVTRINTTDAEVGIAYNFTVKIQDASGIKDLRVDVMQGESILKTFLEADSVGDDVYSFLIPADTITGGNLTVKVTVSDNWETPNVTEESYELVVIDLPQFVSFTPEANSSTGDNKRPTVSVTFTNAGENPTVEMTLNDVAVTPVVEGNTATYTPAADMEDGKVTVRVKVTRADNASAEKTWSFTVGVAQARLYFGMLHSHTAEYSDGSGLLKDAYLHAAAVDHIDFLAVTDHSNYFDTKTDLGDMLDPTKGLMTSDGTMTKWQKAKQTAVEYTTDDFIAIYGYEMTWSGQYGHMNTFNSIGIESRNDAKYIVRNGPGLIAYYDRLVEVAAYDLNPEQGNRTSTVINQFNHPGTTFGTFEDFAHYSPAYDELITMIEVGNGEGKVRAGGYFPSYQYYTMALDKGWHLAPTNNQDNHKGNWGDSNTCRDVIYTDDFSEAGIYEAMHNRTMYATEDTDLEIYYTLNGKFMGAILDPAPEQGEKLSIRIDVNDPTDKIQKISLIANGDTVVTSKTVNSQSDSWEFDIDNNYSYYYVRVDEVDTDIAVTAPVWTSETLKVGMGPIEKNTVVEVKDEPITFTVPLYNYESATGDASLTDLTVTGIEFRIGGELIEAIENPKFSNGTSILSATTKDDALTWTYTPTEVGRFKLEVKVTGLFRGTERVFTGSLDFTVRDGSKMKTMLIDAGHSNFYVSGNYADSDAAFIELAAQYGVRAQHITTPITDEVLSNCDLLVLTVPYQAENNAGNYLYTDDELAAIHNYAERGGNFIVTSKSDRKDPTAEDQWASNISNRILEAIGAKARIGKGIVSDAVNMTNESYRLHFTGKEFYNWNNPLTEYLIENTNLMFSCYNAAPVILNGAESIVNAFDTSFVSSFKYYTSDSNNITEDKIYQPYYDAAAGQDKISVLAYEELSTGGFLLTSGVTFFSTFEVKVELDNWATRQNSNYQMVVNLFKMLNPVEITPIADIQTQYQQDGKLGVSYTIEGYVTSNASGYDKDTAFFDCIYLQDDSGRGINVFPVAGNYQVGQKLRITGMTSEYQGEIELNCGNDYGGEILDITLRDVEYTADGVTTTGYATHARLLDVEFEFVDKQTISSYVIDDSALLAAVQTFCADNRENIVDKTMLIKITTGQAAALEKLGNLVEIEGTVTSVGFDDNDVLGTIGVNDGTGEVIVYLDGYIKCDDGCEKDAKGYHDLSFVEVGAYVAIRGISSSGQNSYADSTAFGPRIRIRNRADIVRAEKPEPVYGDANGDGKITSADAALILRSLVELSELTPEGAVNADADGDGEITAADAVTILRYIVGLITELGPTD